MKLHESYLDGTLSFLKPDTIREMARADFPLVLNLEPTNYCNLHCSCCAPQTKGTRRKGFMGWLLFKRIIDECAAKGPLLMLHFHKDGEPLLHPQIIEMIRYAKQTQCARTLHLNTNGLLLEKVGFENLILSGIDEITVSIDAYDPATYKNLKGRNGLSELVSNVMDLIDTRRKLKSEKPLIRAKMVKGVQNADEIERFTEFWRDKADQVFVSPLHDWSGGFDVDLKKTGQNWWPCPSLWYALAVNWDGRVSLCCLDWMLSGKVGHVKYDSISRIWSGERMRWVRRMALESPHNLPIVCERCKIWTNSCDMSDWLKEQKEFL